MHHPYTQPPSQEQKKLLRQEIADLLLKKAIEPVTSPSPGFGSTMFVIPKRNGGFRPVFNLRKLNQFITAPHFKMETLQHVVKLLQPKDFLTSVDLQDAFLHILVHRTSRKYLRFRWQNQLFQFKTTPFGLSVVPWLFTRLTQPILKWARSQGIRVSAYLDDWLIMARTEEEARDHTKQMISLLQHLGWLVNFNKSHLQPTQVIEHLGYMLDTHSMTIKLPGNKLRDLRRSIKQILMHPYQSARKIHSLTMRIKAATMAIFPAAMYTQGLMRFKNHYVRHQQDWDQARPLPQECIEELTWWNLNLEKWNGRSIMKPTPSSRVYVDASNLGWGGVVQGQVVQGTWTQAEAQQSINWRELKAVQLTLQSFPTLCHTTILIRSDNTTAVSYINKQGGTRSETLSKLATSIWEMCLQRHLHLQAQHIPGILNSIADQASRQIFAKNQWQLMPATFHQLQQAWGVHDVDLFADRTTALLPKYVAWKTDPFALATDAFTLTWNRFKRPLIHPPWNLILPALQKVMREQVTATVIVPWWKSAIWYPLLKQMATRPPIILNPQIHTRVTSSLTPNPWTNPRWRLSVWSVSGASFAS